jgi:O-antigen/teichoic acid export membrane protein
VIRSALWSIRGGSARGDLAVTLAGRILQLALAFVGNVVAARSLGPEDFGRFGLVIAVVMILGTLADSGLTFAAVRFVARFRDSDPSQARSAAGAYFYIRAVTALVLCATGIAAAAPVASTILGQPALQPYISQGSVSLLALWFSGYPGAILSGLSMFPKLAFAGLVNALITVSGVVVLAAVSSLDLGTLVLWNVFLPILSSLPAWVLLPAPWRPWKLAEGPSAVRHGGLELARFGKWTAASTLGAMLAGQVDLLLMGRLADPASTGAYSVAVTLAGRLDVLNQSLFTVLMPRASRLTGGEELRSYTKKVARASGLLAAGLVVVALVAQPLILLFYGADYAASIPMFLILLPVVLVDLIATSSMLVTFSTNQARLMATGEWLRATIVLSLAAVLIGPLGGAGAALARLASRAAGGVYTLWAIGRRVIPRKDGELPVDGPRSGTDQSGVA